MPVVKRTRENAVKMPLKPQPNCQRSTRRIALLPDRQGSNSLLQHSLQEPVPRPSGLPSGPRAIWEKLDSSVWLVACQTTVYQIFSRLASPCNSSHRTVRAATGELYRLITDPQVTRNEFSATGYFFVKSTIFASMQPAELQHNWPSWSHGD